MKKIVKTLSQQEQQILSILDEEKTSEEIAQKANLDDIAVLRNTSYLKEKKLIQKNETKKITYHHTKRGKKVNEEGFPEEKIVNLLQQSCKTFKELQEEVGKEAFRASIGILKKEDAIKIEGTNNGPKAILKKNPFKNYYLKKALKNPNKAKKKSKQELIKRKLIEKKEQIKYSVKLTEKGKKAKEKLKDLDLIGTITPRIIEHKEWKGKEFRTYTITKQVKPRQRGRPHFVKQAINHTHKIWQRMGFSLMEGTHVQSAFWDLDALFVPQDHPAREMQDTFYLDKKSKIPEDIFEKVKKAHEEGIGTSKGWQTKFSKEESKKTLLRTHTTALSAKYIHEAAKSPEKTHKYYTIGRVFRNESLDWKHLMEFHQVEGIVIGKNLTFRRLLGYIEDFFKAMGYTDVRVRPGYFPYTEPSLEIDVYVESQQEWMELGGAGIIREEVTTPLGLPETHTVLAWGLGLDRVITQYYNIEDLREMYKNNLSEDRKRKRYKPCQQ